LFVQDILVTSSLSFGKSSERPDMPASQPLPQAVHKDELRVRNDLPKAVNKDEQHMRTDLPKAVNKDEQRMRTDLPEAMHKDELHMLDDLPYAPKDLNQIQPDFIQDREDSSSFHPSELLRNGTVLIN
jgi:hypothetical protein